MRDARRSERITPEPARHIVLRIASTVTLDAVGRTLAFDLEITNGSTQPVSAIGAFPVNIACFWPPQAKRDLFMAISTES